MAWHVCDTSPFTEVAYAGTVTDIQDDGLCYAMQNSADDGNPNDREIRRHRLSSYDPAKGKWTLISEFPTLFHFVWPGNAFIQLVTKVGNKLYGVYADGNSSSTVPRKIWWYDLQTGENGFENSSIEEGGYYNRYRTQAVAIGSVIYTLASGNTAFSSSAMVVYEHPIGTDIWRLHEAPHLYTGDRPDLSGSYAPWARENATDSRLVAMDGDLYLIAAGSYQTSFFYYNDYAYNEYLFYVKPRIYKFTGSGWTYLSTFAGEARIAFGSSGKSGNLYFTGGSDFPNDGLWGFPYNGISHLGREFWKYNTITNTWSRLEDLPIDLDNTDMVAHDNDKVTIFGGFTYGQAAFHYDDFDMYNPITNLEPAPQQTTARRSGLYMAGVKSLVSLDGTGAIHGSVALQTHDVFGGFTHWTHVTGGPGGDVLYKTYDYWSAMCQGFPASLHSTYPQDAIYFPTDHEDRSYPDGSYPYFAKLFFDETNDCYWALNDYPNRGDIAKWSLEGEPLGRYHVPHNSSYLGGMAFDGEKLAIIGYESGVYTDFIFTVDTAAMAALPFGSTVAAPILYTFPEADNRYVAAYDNPAMAYSPTGELGIASLKYSDAEYYDRDYYFITMISQDGNARHLPLADNNRTTRPMFASLPDGGATSLTFKSPNVAYFAVASGYCSDTSISTKYNGFVSNNEFFEYNPDTDGYITWGQIYEMLFEFNPVSGDGLDVPIKHELTSNYLDHEMALYANGFLSSRFKGTEVRFRRAH